MDGAYLPPRIKIEERDIWKENFYFQTHQHPSPRQYESTVPLSPSSANALQYPFQHRGEAPFAAQHAFPSSPTCYPPPPPFQSYPIPDNYKKNQPVTPQPSPSPSSSSNPTYHTFVPYSPSPSISSSHSIKPVSHQNNDTSPVPAQVSSSLPPPNKSSMDVNSTEMVKQLENILEAEHSECIQVIFVLLFYVFSFVFSYVFPRVLIIIVSVVYGDYVLFINC